MELWEALMTGLVLFMAVNHLYQNWQINSHNSNRYKVMVYGIVSVSEFGRYVRFITRIAAVLVIIYWIWKWSN